MLDASHRPIRAEKLKLRVLYLYLFLFFSFFCGLVVVKEQHRSCHIRFHLKSAQWVSVCEQTGPGRHPKASTIHSTFSTFPRPRTTLIPQHHLLSFNTSKAFIPATGISIVPSSAPFDSPVTQHSPYHQAVLAELRQLVPLNPRQQGSLSHHQSARSIAATTLGIDPRGSLLARYLQRAVLPQHPSIQA